MAETLGVSRRTVREALLILATQGLVTHERNRGATVSKLSAGDVRDLYTVRRTLEVQGARACTTAGARERERLDSAFREFVESARRQDSHEIARRDMAFHGAVIGLVGSPRMDAFYEQCSFEMRLAIALIRQDEDLTETTPEQAIAEHGRIYDALRNRESFEAQLAIIEHIDANERRLLALV